MKYNLLGTNLICLVFCSQEQIYDFYETLRNGSSGSIEQFQSILEVFVCDIIKYRKEIKRLEDSYKRYFITKLTVNLFFPFYLFLYIIEKKK